MDTRRYTLVHEFCFFKLFPIGCIGIKKRKSTRYELTYDKEAIVELLKLGYIAWLSLPTLLLVSTCHLLPLSGSHRALWASFHDSLLI